MSEKKSLTRREFVKKASQAGLAVALSGVAPSLVRNVRAAAKREFILVGHPNPSTGPIASFGEASPWADELATQGLFEFLDSRFINAHSHYSPPHFLPSSFSLNLISLPVVGLIF